MDFKLKFRDTDAISTFNNDQIIISFPKDYLGNSIMQPYVPLEVSVDLPKQIPPEEELHDSVGALAGWLSFVTFIMFISCIVMSLYKSEPLRIFWSWFSFLQLLVHLPICRGPLPENFERFLGTIFPWVSMVRMEQYVEMRFFFYTFTAPISNDFYAVGYKTRNFMENMDSLSTVALWGPVLVTFLVLSIRCCTCCCTWTVCKVTSNFARTNWLIFAIWIRFFIQVFFVATLCVAITFLTPQLELSDAPGPLELENPMFSDDYSVMVAYIAAGLNMVFVAFLMILCCDSKTYARAKMEERNSKFTSEILFAYTASRWEIIKKHARARDRDGNFVGEYTPLSQRIINKFGLHGKMEKYLTLNELANPTRARPEVS
jgi:hypothetical protein